MARISVSSALLDGYDDPETLHYSITQICLTSADARHAGHRYEYFRQAWSTAFSGFAEEVRFVPQIGGLTKPKKRPLRVCAVVSRCFPVGARPTRLSIRPEATGAVMEVTKWLKPSGSVSRIGDSARVHAATRMNVEQASKRTMCRPTRRPFRGRLTCLGC